MIWWTQGKAVFLKWENYSEPSALKSVVQNIHIQDIQHIAGRQIKPHKGNYWGLSILMPGRLDSINEIG